jgi:hypothetical protein
MKAGDSPTEGRAFLDQNDLVSGLRCLQGRGDPGDAATHDENRAFVLSHV